MQLLMGISTNLYLPAIGTAGFDRLAVSGYKRLPAPPPKITATTDVDMLAMSYGLKWLNGLFGSMVHSRWSMVMDYGPSTMDY
jgi:hypothetical protein